MSLPRSINTFAAVVTATLLALGAPASAVENGGTYGNWTVRCDSAKFSEGEKGCFIYQNLVLREGGQRVLQVAVGYVPGTPEPIVLLSLPLGISLPPGTSIRIDDGGEQHFPIERCEPNGCRAGVNLTPEFLAQFHAGKKLMVTFYDSKREPIEVPLSLDGFETGLKALKQPGTS